MTTGRINQVSRTQPQTRTTVAGCARPRPVERCSPARPDVSKRQNAHATQCMHARRKPTRRRNRIAVAQCDSQPQTRAVKHAPADGLDCAQPIRTITMLQTETTQRAHRPPPRRRQTGSELPPRPADRRATSTLNESTHDATRLNPTEHTKWMLPHTNAQIAQWPHATSHIPWPPGRDATPSRSSNRSSSHRHGLRKPRSARRRRSWGEFTQGDALSQETCPMLSLWWRRRGHTSAPRARTSTATPQASNHATRRRASSQPTLAARSAAWSQSQALPKRPTAAELAGLSVTRARQ